MGSERSGSVRAGDRSGLGGFKDERSEERRRAAGLVRAPANTRRRHDAETLQAIKGSHRSRYAQANRQIEFPSKCGWV